MPDSEARMSVRVFAQTAHVTVSVPTPAIGITENRDSVMTGNRLRLTFYLDTNVLDDSSDWAVSLRSLSDAGWIDLVRTDTMDTELLRKPDADARAALLAQSALLPESLGVLVPDHSRIDSSVLGNEDDQARLDRVFAILFPYADRYSESGRARGKIRDAMHVATAIRYGATAFVTLDRDDILVKAQDIEAAFDGFKILSVADAAALAATAKASYRHPA